MKVWKLAMDLIVNYRIGSLENGIDQKHYVEYVNYRIGSLETTSLATRKCSYAVNYRIGSLETLTASLDNSSRC